MSKTAVLTGINGMDSKTLTHLLIKQNYHIILTRRTNSVLDVEKILELFEDDLKKHPKAKISVELMDVTDQKSVEMAILDVLEKFGKIDEFYHLAGFTHVGESFKNFSLSINTNGLSAFYILETLKKYSSKTRFYFANTSECFGGNPNNCPFREGSLQELRSPYSLGKNLGANTTKYFRESFGMYACYGWLFNHSNIYRKDNFFFMKIIKAAARITLGRQKNLGLGNLNFWRDEHLSDFGCEMMVKMLNNSLGPKDYVIGNGKANHGEEFLDCAFNYFNLDWKKYVTFDKDLLRPNEVVKLVSDPTKAVMELGWKENRITLKQHIDYVSDYVFQQESGKKPIRKDPFELFPVKSHLTNGEDK